MSKNSLIYIFFFVFIALALSTLTATMNSQPMLNLTVEDYLWGYDDPLVKLAANIIPSITFETFGLLDRVSQLLFIISSIVSHFHIFHKMFDEGTNEVTINLPKQVQKHKESQKEVNFLHAEPKYDSGDENVLNNLIDSELMSFADSLDKKGKHTISIVDLINFD